MWKKIKNTSYYEVNELGQVRSLDKYGEQFNGKKQIKRFYPSTVLKEKDIRGYKNVSIIYDDKKRRMKQVHRLVMEAFSPCNDQDVLQVNHKDGDKSNNNIANLEWCTCKENIEHAHKNGLIKNKRNQNGEKNNLAKLTDEDVTKVISLIKAGHPNTTIAELFNVKGNTISNIRTGHTWKHIPR